MTKGNGYAMIRVHTVEAHFAKSSPTEQVTRTVVGEKGADAEGGDRRVFALVRGNKICRIVAFAESYQCFLAPFAGAQIFEDILPPFAITCKRELRKGK